MKPPRRRSRVVGVSVFLLVLSRVTPAASAQEQLPLLTENPGSVEFACPAWTPPVPPAPDAAREARTLASEADEALVLGDLERAQAFLGRALDLDGGAPDLLYRHARVLEAQGARAEAIDQFCRALAAGIGTEDIGDAQHRLDSLTALDRPNLSPTAIAAFDRGVSLAQAGQPTGAALAFEAAVREEPEWAPAVYNAGVVNAQRGERFKAMEQLRRYLALAPDAPDAVAVSRTIGRWEAEATSVSTRRLPDPGATLALGLFLPGTGQFYSGRPWPGVGVLAAAAGAIATGLLVREVTVRCVGSTEPGGSCPPDQVVGRRTSRPHLGLALGVAAGVSAIGAVEAFLRARSARGDRGTFLASLSGDDVVLLSIGVP